MENGVYVIGACGFDSIPADLGQICVKKEMEGEVNSIETYLKVIIPDLPGAAINFATWQVFVQLNPLLKSLLPTNLPLDYLNLCRVPSTGLPTPKNSEV